MPKEDASMNVASEERPKKPSADEFVPDTSFEERLALMTDDFSTSAIQKLYQEKKKDAPTEETVANLRYAFLRVLSDPLKNNSFWFRVREAETQNRKANRQRSREREDVVLALWRRIQEEDSKSLLHHHDSVIHHQNHFSNWFLSRYDVARSRAVFAESVFLRHIHYSLLGGLLALAFLRSDWDSPLALDLTWSGIVGLYAASVLIPWVVALGRAKGIRSALRRGVLGDPFGAVALTHCVQALIPRLAATVLVGYLFLLSAGDLAGYLADGVSLRVVLAAGLVLLASLWLQMSKRIQTPLTPRALLIRSLGVLATGACHAVGIVTLGWRLVVPTVEMTFSGVLKISMFVLTLGWIFNVIWADEPVTEPL